VTWGASTSESITLASKLSLALGTVVVEVIAVADPVAVVLVVQWVAVELQEVQVPAELMEAVRMEAVGQDNLADLQAVRVVMHRATKVRDRLALTLVVVAM